MKFKEFVEKYKYDKISQFVDMFGDDYIISYQIDINCDSAVENCYICLIHENIEVDLKFKIVRLNKKVKELCRWMI